MDRGGMRGRLAAGLFLLAAAPAAHADEDARWYLQIDNDVVFGTDRWYTSGARVARVADGIEWGVAQEIYTPDAKHWTPGTIDRIPTARLLASVARHDTACGQSESHGVRSASHTDAMRGATEFCKLAFELLYLGPAHKPGGAQDVLQGRH